MHGKTIAKNTDKNTISQRRDGQEDARDKIQVWRNNSHHMVQCDYTGWKDS
jgi:Zn ribbon nucleic-acid-binding protein